MKNSKAIVTFAVGGGYLAAWRRYCEPGWRAYAERHGYDIICCDAPLDATPRAMKRSVAWQKCLVLSQDFASRYDRIVWLDADILINAACAPPVESAVPPEKAGAVDAWAQPAPAAHALMLERAFAIWKSSGASPVVNYDARAYYENYGLPPEFDAVVQTGMLALSPKHHREILEHVYYSYEERGGPEWNYEMRPLSYELLKAGAVHWVDGRFNRVWFADKVLHYPFLFRPQQHSSRLPDRLRRRLMRLLGLRPGCDCARLCATSAFMNSFFLHFAGCAGEMELVDPAVASYQDMLSRYPLVL
jgi:hypothetical protein